jgi:hypothetical protein
MANSFVLSRALAELATLQAQYHQASDPALRFVGLLRAAQVTGHEVLLYGMCGDCRSTGRAKG